MLRKLTVALLGAVALALPAVQAAACGGLVAPNGAIRLTRATTLIAYRDGVEHYMTSFSYQGSAVSDFGWIVPLPTAPDKVEEGGGWTLQRLNRETHPQVFLTTEFGAAQAAPRAADSAIVLQQVQVRALDITVLKGSGQAIVDWCEENHFLLNDETRAHLQVYAHGSPFFMAAKYNVARAEATRQVAGDGAPVLITMHLAHPWVPLEVLANGVAQVNADLYFITDKPVATTEMNALTGQSSVGQFVPGIPGLAVQFQEAMNQPLFRDLSSDKNMGWIPATGWLTYMTLEAPATSVTYDLGISEAGVVRTAPFGTVPMQVVDGNALRPAAYKGPTAPMGTARVAVLGLMALLLMGTGYWVLLRGAAG